MSVVRSDPVLEFDVRPLPGPLKRVLDQLTAVFGKVVSLSVCALLLDTVGVTVTNAASGAGTAISTTRTAIDFQDAGVDAVRVITRGQNSGANAVTVQVFNTTTSVALASATITGTSEQTGIGDWATFLPNGGDEQIEVRVIGDGADDPILFGVHLQMRTQAVRS